MAVHACTPYAYGDPHMGIPYPRPIVSDATEAIEDVVAHSIIDRVLNFRKGLPVLFLDINTF